MDDDQIVAGIDIGGTNTVIGVLDINGTLINETCIPTNSFEGIERFLPRLISNLTEIIRSFKSKQLIGIGIAAPTANHFKGTLEGPSNIRWGKVNIINEIRKYYNVPIVLDNDANAAALGELKFGTAKGLNNFVVLTLGTGVGSGVVINGDIFYGANGLAGELGHTVVEPNGRRCSCGNLGCLETYISATGIKRTVSQLLCDYKEESVLREISFNELTSKKIYEAAVNKDFIALKAFKVTGTVLGRALANFVCSFDPEAFVLFGGLVDAGDLLLIPTQKSFDENLLEMYKGKVKIFLSNLQNGGAAVLGAGIMVLNYIKNQS